MCKIVSMRKIEPTKKESALYEFIESVEKLQSHLTPIGRQGDLWVIFNNLSLFVGACMQESIAGKGRK